MGLSWEQMSLEELKYDHSAAFVLLVSRIPYRKRDEAKEVQLNGHTDCYTPSLRYSKK